MAENSQKDLDKKRGEMSGLIFEAACNDDLNFLKVAFGPYVSLFEKSVPGTTAADVASVLLGPAAECNARKVAQYLIDQGADVNLHLKGKDAYDNYKGSFLNQALYYSAYKSAHVLIKAGIDLTAVDGKQRAALHYALTYGSQEPDIALALLEKGADVHARDYIGMTPLHFAAEHNVHPKVLSALLEKGADLFAKNEKGKTPYDMANGEVKAFFDGHIKKQKEKREREILETERKLAAELLEANRKQAAAHREQLKKLPPAGGLKNKPR